MANANAATMAIVNEIFAALPNRFRFTSGYRTAAQNRAVNGVANSYHLTGQAADFVPIDGRFIESEKATIRAILKRYCYELVDHNAESGRHYHIEPVSRSGNCNYVQPTAIVTAKDIPNLLASSNPAPIEDESSNSIGIGLMFVIGILGIVVIARR